MKDTDAVVFTHVSNLVSLMALSRFFLSYVFDPKVHLVDVQVLYFDAQIQLRMLTSVSLNVIY